jgi:hypothetical protein
MAFIRDCCCKKGDERLRAAHRNNDLRRIRTPAPTIQNKQESSAATTPNA